MNPIDWLSWFYGRFFLHQVWWGYLVTCIMGCIVLSVIALPMWLRAVDKYRESHPEQQTATIPAQSVNTTASPDSKRLPPTRPLRPLAKATIPSSTAYPSQQEEHYGTVETVEAVARHHGADGKPSLKVEHPSATYVQSKISEASIKVTNKGGEPVSGVEILIVKEDGTHLNKMVTDEKGSSEVPDRVSEPVTIFCASPSFRHYYATKVDLGRESLAIQMEPKQTGGSLIISDGTGYVPGLDGRLNPIQDTLRRTYLYADNIAIEGENRQPYSFTVRQPFRVRDSHGHSFQLEIISIVGASSLIEYNRLPD